LNWDVFAMDSSELILEGVYTLTSLNSYSPQTVLFCIKQVCYPLKHFSLISIIFLLLKSHQIYMDKQSVLDTTVCDKVCQLPAEGRWFSPGTPVSATNGIDPCDITEILLKVALNTITLTHMVKNFVFIF
jgi:hypothetical protein